MPIITALGRLLRPPDCLACGAADAWPCCAACLPPEPAGPGPWRLAADPGVTLWALGLYGDALRAAIIAGKLRGQPAALHALGRRLGAALVSAGIGADLVTWVAARPARGLPRDHADQTAAVSPPPSTCPWSPCSLPRPVGTSAALAAMPMNPIASVAWWRGSLTGLLPAAGAASPAAGSWWSTTSPPPAAPSPAPPGPCAGPVPARSRSP